MRRVEIIKGMQEFVGQTGTALYKEGRQWRVRLDKPVKIPGVGLVRDDLWDPEYLMPNWRPLAPGKSSKQHEPKPRRERKPRLSTQQRSQQ